MSWSAQARPVSYGLAHVYQRPVREAPLPLVRRRIGPVRPAPVLAIGNVVAVRVELAMAPPPLNELLPRALLCSAGEAGCRVWLRSDWT